jgi:ankyrin repeat protein
MMAAENGCVPCAAALLSAGATATVAAANGARALDYAQRGGASEELVSLLSARDAPVRARALLAALDAGAVRAQPGCNPSALERAEARDRLGLVEKCVEVGTDPNLTFTFAGAMVPVSGYTLLMVAAETSRLGLARRLLGAGAKAGAAASDGTTALMLAAQAGSMELVSLLLSAGADPDAEARGKTAYQLAVDALAIDVARLLRTRMKHPPTLP